ncbi:PDR6 [Symbiodinium sp. CCMP2592]|nr:PDR6 [Symbiodinium sp. CCMP2592]
MRHLEPGRQMLMTVGFVHLLRFLMVEVSEACHMASVLNNEPEDLEETADTVDVEVDGSSLVQTRLELDKLDRWHRLLTTLQKELAGQSKSRRRSHVHQLRARLYHIVNTDAWTAEEDQFFALLIGMSESETTQPVDVDQMWIDRWGSELAAFMPGMDTPIQIVQAGTIMVEESQDPTGGNTSQADIDAHVADEHYERDLREQEQLEAEKEVAAIQQYEEDMLRRQAAAYQAWEDWEIQAAQTMASGRQPAPRRKRCILEVEVASGSAEVPRIRRRQVYVVPEEGQISLSVKASMVDDIPDSDASTIVLQPPEEEGTTVMQELDFDEFMRKYCEWKEGIITAEYVQQTYGKVVLDMMEAQYAAQVLEDCEVEGRGHLNSAGSGATGLDSPGHQAGHEGGVLPAGQTTDTAMDSLEMSAEPPTTTTWTVPLQPGGQGRVVDSYEGTHEGIQEDSSYQGH